MKRFLSIVLILALVLLPLLAFACRAGKTVTVTTIIGSPSGTGLTYSADLAGQNEIPPVTTTSTAHVDITFDSRLTQAAFNLVVKGVQGAISSQLHLADAASTGPAVASLYSSATGVNSDNLVITGTLRDGDLLGQVASIADLQAAMASGVIYCDLHTLNNPSGAIRGQMQASGASAAEVAGVFSIVVSSSGFNPREITISPGTTVVWFNPSNQPIEIASDSGGFGAVIKAGQTYEYTFTNLATYGYHLKSNTGVTGTINVS